MTDNSRSRIEEHRSFSTIDLKTLPQTIGLEHQDRVHRLNRLALIEGIPRPQIDELQLAAGEVPGFDYAIPIVRIIFDEKVFFDFDQDIPRPNSEKILDIIAQNMLHDVPDAKVLVLGHTDAVGSTDYNMGLSRRRADTVIRELIKRGVDRSELQGIAIGAAQPIAPNYTDDGRARNRRVEFMISASAEANRRLVERRRVNEANLALTQKGSFKPQPERAEIIAAVPFDIKLSAITTRPIGLIELPKPLPSADFPIPITQMPEPATLITPDRAAPQPKTKPDWVIPEPVEQAKIDNEFSLGPEPKTDR